MKTLPWLLALFSPLAVGQTLPAFYGAEGGGALSVGGRGGSVCIVDRLTPDDNNPGSLRYCVNQSGPQTVVFRVGGTINLTSTLRITNPYITIAGHTAPGGGIQLRGDSHCNNLVDIDTSHVILRYVSLRKGRCSNPDKFGVMASHSGHNVIIDHVSSYWSYGVNRAWWGETIHHHTVQNSIFAEGLRGYNVGMLSGEQHYTKAEKMVNMDVHKNLFAHFGYRVPLLKNKSSRIVNNIIYSWNTWTLQLGPMDGDVINNLWKHPRPNMVKQSDWGEIQVFLYHPTNCPGGTDEYIREDPSIYAAGNQGPLHGTDNWNMVKRVWCEGGGVQETLPAQYRRSSPLAPVGAPITVIPTEQLESTLYPIVGDSRRLDCMGNWVDKRDSQDARIVSEAQTNLDRNFDYSSHWESFGIYSENDVGGFPTIAEGMPCVDTDGDGMPNEWEIANGLNPNNDADRNTVHASGYTMLEMYLNGPMEGQVLTLAPPQNVRFSQ
jgi:hypothetical protein